MNLPSQVMYIEKVTDAGPGKHFYVAMKDGFLVDCGIDVNRAHKIAQQLYDGEDYLESLRP